MTYGSSCRAPRPPRTFRVNALRLCARHRVLVLAHVHEPRTRENGTGFRLATTPPTCHEKEEEGGGKTKNGYKDSCYILQIETDELIFQREATWKPRIIYFVKSQFVSCKLRTKDASSFISTLFLCIALAISLLEP